MITKAPVDLLTVHQVSFATNESIETNDERKTRYDPQITQGLGPTQLFPGVDDPSSP